MFLALSYAAPRGAGRREAGTWTRGGVHHRSSGPSPGAQCSQVEEDPCPSGAGTPSAARVAANPSEAIAARVAEVAAKLRIGHILHKPPAQLSGGERQRVAIARALATGAQLLLMDEPLAALDLQRKREILPYLERLHDELDMPVIYVSHAPDEVARLADHLVVLDEGRVTASGALGDELVRFDLPVRLGEDAGTVLDGAVAEIDRDWHLARVDIDGGSLWVRDSGLAVGQRVRLRVLARDVSLALEPGRSSIQNLLRGQVDAIADDDYPGQALVRVRVGDTRLLARLTRRAIASLGVAPGQDLWVQIKSVALLA